MRRTVFFLALGAAGASGAVTGSSRDPTFARDVAPIVFSKCAPCHHEGGAGPFALMSFDDVVDHAQDIRRVTAERFMPPWRPARGYAEYANDRSLTPAQIDVLARWIDGGLDRGDGPIPAPPVFPAGWALGDPDAIVELAEPYALAPTGRDVYRNFVVRAPVDRARYVVAWELRPGTRTLHHAIVNVDRLGLARARDALDAEPGFGGIDIGDVQAPDGLYLVWAPGRTPARAPDDARRLDPRTDLVLQLHLQPSGKPETIAPRIALYFGDAPPKRTQMLLRMGDPPIDIAPGDRHYVVRSDFPLPADVDVLSVFPHAHYLARTFRSWATLPDGSERHLLLIEDWDFAWQDQYTFARPVALPAGSTIHMEVSFDNSEGNPRNPSRPPRRVTTGERSIDEMANLTFQVVPKTPDGAALLRVARSERLLALGESARAHYNLGNALADLGRRDEAIAQYRRAIELDPKLAPAHFNLSTQLAAKGDAAGSIRELREAIAVKPDYVDAHLNLGVALLAENRIDDAIAEYRAAIAADPGSMFAHANLAVALAKQHDTAGAARELRAAIAIEPSSWRVHYLLGNVLRDDHDAAGAEQEYRRAVELQPSAPEPRQALAALGAR